MPIGGAIYGMVDVEDCAMGHVLALEKGRPGQCYHLVDENLRFADLVPRAAEVSGLPGRQMVFPDWMLRLNAALVSVVERVLPLPDVMSRDSLRGMEKSVVLTVAHKKARAELGWSTRPLANSLREIMTDELRRMGKPLPPLLPAACEPR